MTPLQGIHIERNGSMVLIKNRSNSSVYIQSMNWNMRNKQSDNYILKLASQDQQEIFCSQFFAEKMREAVHGGELLMRSVSYDIIF